jgi:hypothetical protein
VQLIALPDNTAFVLGLDSNRTFTHQIAVRALPGRL